MIVANAYNHEPPQLYTTTAFEFDGTDEVICSPVTPSLVISGAFSLHFEFKTSDTKGYQNIIARDDTGGSNRQLILTVRDTGYIQIYLWDSAANLILISGSTTGLNNGAWHSVSVTSTGTSAANGLKLYVDGSLDGQATITAGGARSIASNTPYAIGNYSSTTPSGTTFSFNGRISNPGIWIGTTLSATDVANLDAKTEDPYTLSASMIPYFDGASFGSAWTIADFLPGGDTWTSYNMESGDRYTDGL